MTRLKQGYFHLFGRLNAFEEAWVAGLLGEGEFPFFEKMHRADRFHCCRVAQCLEKAGAPLHVLKAALLHDFGKPASYGLLSRTLAVLNFPFALEVKKNHPREGAKKLEGVLGKEALELILFHHEKEKKVVVTFPWLDKLQEADGLN
ncbi:MAG TPA: hypothetical protein DD435_01540 [Cyanobacteria bacterium UBA8530]|nr:hypothetical protein [Cyanobacteria bacterium UBA8530]